MLRLDFLCRSMHLDGDAVLVQIIRERSQRSLSKQQINIFQTDLLRFLEAEKDNWEGNDEVPG